MFTFIIKIYLKGHTKNTHFQFFKLKIETIIIKHVYHQLCLIIVNKTMSDHFFLNMLNSCSEQNFSIIKESEFLLLVNKKMRNKVKKVDNLENLIKCVSYITNYSQDKTSYNQLLQKMNTLLQTNDNILEIIVILMWDFHTQNVNILPINITTVDNDKIGWTTVDKDKIVWTISYELKETSCTRTKLLNYKKTVMRSKRQQRIEERKHWSFDQEKDAITTFQNVSLETVYSKDSENEESENKDLLEKKMVRTVICKHCSGEHFSIKCPLNTRKRTEFQDISIEDNFTDFIISNLPYDAEASYIRNLLLKYGNVKHVHIPVYKYGELKGTKQDRCFVQFYRLDNESIEKVLKLDGYKYGNNILSVEINKNSK